MKPKIKYINRLGDGMRETVDTFTVKNMADNRYVKKMLKEYQLSDNSAHYYISQRGIK